MQVSHCISPKRSPTGDLQSNRIKNPVSAVWIEKSRNTGAEAFPDHIHMLTSISSLLRMSQFVGSLTGKSSLTIFNQLWIWNINTEIATSVLRLWCQYIRCKSPCNCNLYSKSTGRGSGNGAINAQKVHGPVYGSLELKDRRAHTVQWGRLFLCKQTVIKRVDRSLRRLPVSRLPLAFFSKPVSADR